MMRALLHRLALVTGLSILAPAAFAASSCPNTIQIKDANANIQYFCVTGTNSPSGANSSSNPWQFVGTFGDAAGNPYSSTIPQNTGAAPGYQSLTPTVGATTDAAGVDIGGVLTFNSFFRTTGASPPGSGMLTTISLTDTSSTGATNTVGAVLIYLFNANPNNSGTTITDGSTFALGATDTANLIGPPILLACQAIGSGASSTTVCGADGISRYIKLASGTTMYAAIVVAPGASRTEGANKISLNMSGQID